MTVEKKICFETEKATQIIAYLEDFDGDVAAWKNAFYELWRWQMCWNYAYTIEVMESRKSGVFVCLVVRNGYLNDVLSAMEELGYRNVMTFDEQIALVDGYDFGETIDNVFCE